MQATVDRVTATGCIFVTNPRGLYRIGCIAEAIDPAAVQPGRQVMIERDAWSDCWSIYCLLDD